MEVILYTTHCPICKMLEKRLADKKVSYTECTDVAKMKSLGIKQVPVLSLDGVLYNTQEAMKWLNERN